MKRRLISLNLAIIMMLTLLPIQVMGIVIDDDGPLYRVVLHGNGGNFDGNEEEVIGADSDTINLWEYPFKKDGYVLLGWSINPDANTIDAPYYESYWFGNQKKETIDLFAVWYEGSSCAVFDFSENYYNDWTVEDANASMWYGEYYYVAGSITKLPEAIENRELKFVGWHDRTNGYYEAGDSIGEGCSYYTPIGINQGGCYILLNANGGVNESGRTYAYGGSTVWGRHAYIDNLIYINGNTTHVVHGNNKILDRWDTQENGCGVSSEGHYFEATGLIDERVVLYAQWKPTNILSDSTKLVIDGENQTEFLDLNLRGTNWSYSNSTLQLYQGARLSSVARVDDLAVFCSDSVETGAIEAGRALDIEIDGADLSVTAKNEPAMHAGYVEILGYGKATIKSENAVAIDAAYLYIGSPNITIVGSSAVRDDTVIVCEGGIEYSVSDDKTTITTYETEHTLTLHGNGGTLNSDTQVDVICSRSSPVLLQDYPFTREGYRLVGWNSKADYSGNFQQLEWRVSWDYNKDLYAVWVPVPPTDHVIFKVFGNNADSTEILGYATKSSFVNWPDFYCYELTDSFTMPTVQQVPQKGYVCYGWNKTSDSDLVLYYAGEQAALSSGEIFFDCYSFLRENEHAVILDANGGVCREKRYDYNTQQNLYWYGKAVVATRQLGDGECVNIKPDIYRTGHELVSFNTEPDGTGTTYPLNKITASAGMDKVQILYAQWEPLDDGYKYYTIDGITYDATVSEEGNGWRYWVDENCDCGYLYLENFNGNAICANLMLNISFSGENSIVASDGYGIYSTEDLEIYSANRGHLTVRGADGYEAIVTESNLSLSSTTAIGGNKPAVRANVLETNDWWPHQVLVGQDEASAIVGDYDNQTYLSCERFDYYMTFHGNGGKTDDNQSSKRVLVDSGSPGWLFLYEQKDLFTNGDKQLLGWSESENSTDTIHAVDEEYQFAENTYLADLYAVWEDEINKGVILKNFYGRYGSTGWHKGDEVVSFVEVGNKFTLPEPHRNGCAFDGWIAEDNTTIYNAGEEIIVSKTACFTAKYSPLSITIDGKTFDASKDWGSNSNGWRYYAGEDAAQLNIYENYSGKPISIPTDASITLEGDVYGENNRPAIFVDGDLTLFRSSFSTSTKASILVGNSAPAISVAGTVNIVSSYQYDDLIICGEEQYPAIVGESIWLYPSFFFAGTNSNNEKLVTSYSGERYVRLCGEEDLKISLQNGEVVPSIDNSEPLGFIGYTKKSRIEYPDALNTVWYLPGDTISEPGGIEIFPQFLKEQLNDYTYARIVSIDGNGGTASTGSKHSVEYVWLQATPTTLQQYRLPSGDRFSREGYLLSGYNTAADGTGTSYSIGQGINQDESILVHKFYAQWRYVGGSSSSSGSPTTPKPTIINNGAAEVTKTDAGVNVSVADASKLISESSGEKLAILDLSKVGEGVKQASIQTDAINDVAEAGADSLEIKMPDATVSFDAKSLESILSQTAGTDISLTVSVGANAESALNNAQKAAFRDANEYSVIDISLMSNGEKISDFDGGCVTVDIPFKWTKKGFLRAYYVDESGQKTPIDITYANGTASLILTHFSAYVIEVSEQIPFVDVPQGKYYYDAVAWALNNSITQGTTTTTFAPNAITTRAQMVTFLWRAAGSPEPASTESSFMDIEPNAFYYKAVLWAVENGVTKGISDTVFAPDETVTRGQCVTFLARYKGVQDNAIAYKHSFSDVTSTDYFNNAVAWAEMNGITTGTTETTFAPKDTCTRGQIVTFLYRAFVK